jgi:hypothetical protein
MPLVSKKKGRISPYDVILVRENFVSHQVSLPEPVPPLYNGIDGVVIIGASFKGIPCAVRMQGLNGNIANEQKTPVDACDERNPWAFFIKGLQRGVAYKFGPMLYAVFEAQGGLVPQRDKSNIAASSLKTLLIGVNAVELMKGTLFDYGWTSRGELNIDDFNQFVELYTRMKKAYAAMAPKFPYDLHANNCMYKLVDGRRVWLWTDIDEGPYYMRPNTDSPREMAVKLFTAIQRPDAMYTPAPTSPPKKAASPRRSALPVVPAPKPKSPARAKVPTSSDLARAEAKTLALLKRKGVDVAAAYAAPAAAARPAVRKPRRTAQYPLVKSPVKKSSGRMEDAKVISRKSGGLRKPYSPMMGVVKKVSSPPKKKKSRSPIKPYAPLDTYLPW